MTYPLPPELAQKLLHAITKALDEDDTGFSSTEDVIYDRVVEIFVRENRCLRQKVLTLWRDFKEAADSHEGEYGAVMAASGGEFTCQHINGILKEHVYYNTKDAAERKSAVEDLIEGFYKEMDDD